MSKPIRAILLFSALVLVGCPKSTSTPDANLIVADDAGVDAGSQGACVLGNPPVQADCEQGCAKSCIADGVLGACQPLTQPCPVPAHAEARCLAGGQCGRGPCELGYFDFDPAVPGCEAKCVDRVCTLADGGTVTLNNDPLHERSQAFHALSSGASFGDQTQRSDGGYQNIGTLGELAVGTSSSDGGYTNYGGFMSVVRGPSSQRH